MKKYAIAAAALISVVPSLTSAAVTLHTSSFIAGPVRTNDFSNVTSDGAKHSGWFAWDKPHTQQGVTVTVHQAPGAFQDAILTDFGVNGSKGLYSLTAGYTSIQLLDGAAFNQVQFALAAGDANQQSLAYELYYQGSLVGADSGLALLTIPGPGSGEPSGYLTYGFSGGQFDEVRLQSNTTGGPLDGALKNILAIDDVLIADPGPQTVGLFLGVHDRGAPGSPDLRGDLAAEALGAAFEARYGEATVLTGSLIDGGGISKATIASAISGALDRLGPQDTLLLYGTAHGSSDFSPVGLTGVGNERLRFSSLGLTDDELTAILSHPHAGAIIAVLDACMSGGFWGSGDLFELLDSGDLEQIERLALITTSAEYGLGYYFDDGRPLTALAFGELLEAGGALTPESIYQAISSWPSRNNAGYGGQFVFEMGFGDPQAFAADLYSPTINISADFPRSQAVPEPATWGLMIAGFGIAGASLRRKYRRAHHNRRGG